MTPKSRPIRAILYVGLLALLWFANPRAPHAAAQGPAPEAATVGVGRLSIPAAAFVPAAQYNNYENHGRYLKHLSGDPAVELGYYLAPVLLPHGATLSKLTFTYRDSTAGQAVVDLVRHRHDTQDTILVAQAVSLDNWAPGFGSMSTSNFNPTSIIDNNLYAYFLSLALPPGGQVWGCGVEIEFLPPAGTPAGSVVSVPPAAFAPYEDGVAYFNAGWNLTHNRGAILQGDRGWYLAPLHLPDGANVTRMVFHWLREDTLDTGTARLQRTRLGADTYEDLAVASSAPGVGALISSSGDTTIEHPLVDNSRYAYWIILDLPATSLPGFRVEAREVDIHFQLPSISPGRLSVPAASFRPYEDGYDYEDHGRHLLHKHGPAGSAANGWYLAPLNLPDGATIRKMTFYWYRSGASTGVAKMQRTRLGEGNYEDLAVAAAPPGGATNGSSAGDTVSGGPVDNSRYAYWLVWDLPAGATPTAGVHGQAVVIDYGFSAFVPLILGP